MIIERIGSYFFMDKMYEFCNKKYKVLKEIDSFYKEASKKMVKCKNIVILEGVTCNGSQRLYLKKCDRNCFLFWLKAWLGKMIELHRKV